MLICVDWLPHGFVFTGGLGTLSRLERHPRILRIRDCSERHQVLALRLGWFLTSILSPKLFSCVSGSVSITAGSLVVPRLPHFGRFRQWEIQLVLQLPDERTEFPGDRHDCFVLPLSPGLELHVALVQTVLHPPRKFLHFFGLTFLPFAQSGADLRRLSIVLATLHQHPACMGVSAFGNAVLPAFVPRGVFPG